MKKHAKLDAKYDLRINREQLAQLQAIAGEEDLPVSYLIRRAVKDLLKRSGGNGRGGVVVGNAAE